VEAVEANEDPKRLRALGLVQLAVALTAIVLGVYAVHDSMPYNSVHLPFEEHVQMHVFLPEGWKFFTRDPQEDDPMPYLQDADGRWQPAGSVSYAASGSALGMSRTVRARGVELGMIVSALPKGALQTCDGTPDSCLAHASVAATMTNESPTPSLCGAVGIVTQRPVPWAWSRSGRPVEMPSRVALVQVRC
jgi:antimicrobial peptide system SdpA family protein